MACGHQRLKSALGNAQKHRVVVHKVWRCSFSHDVHSRNCKMILYKEYSDITADKQNYRRHVLPHNSTAARDATATRGQCCCATCNTRMQAARARTAGNKPTLRPKKRRKERIKPRYVAVTYLVSAITILSLLLFRLGASGRADIDCG